MTNSTTTRSKALGGKRERLITAACETVYQQGIEKTTIADIAAAADIPVGNVYYYFKAKDDIIQAVIESHLREADALSLPAAVVRPVCAMPANGSAAVVRPVSAARAAG